MKTTKLVELRQDPTLLEMISKLFHLHRQTAQHGQELFPTEEAWIGCAIIETADQIAGVIDMLAERFGFTIDQVTEPFSQPKTA